MTLTFNLNGQRGVLPYLPDRFEETLMIGGKPHIVSVAIGERKQASNLLSIDAFCQGYKLRAAGTVYVFFPTPLRVDEKIYKMYSAQYDSLLKEVPKHIRSHFTKLILFEAGIGEHSFQAMKARCAEVISNCWRGTLQRKIEELSLSEKDYTTVKSLNTAYLTKHKLALLYRQLKLDTLAHETLMALYLEFMTHSTVYTAFRQPKTNQGSPRNQGKHISPPYIFGRYEEVTEQMDGPQCFLNMTTYLFLEMFELEIEMMLQFEAVRKLKQFVEDMPSRVFYPITHVRQDICLNLWTVAVLERAIDIIALRGSSYPALVLSKDKDEEYLLLQISITSTFRNSVEKIGALLYQLNTYLVFPSNITDQLLMCVSILSGNGNGDGNGNGNGDGDGDGNGNGNGDTQGDKKEDTQGDKKGRRRSPSVSVPLETALSELNCCLHLLLGDFSMYKVVYLKALVMVQEALARSPFQRVAWSMKLSVLKAVLAYFRGQMHLQHQQDDIVSIYTASVFSRVRKLLRTDGQTGHWSSLQVLFYLYSCTLITADQEAGSEGGGAKDWFGVILHEDVVNNPHWRALVNVARKSRNWPEKEVWLGDIASITLTRNLLTFTLTNKLLLNADQTQVKLTVATQKNQLGSPPNIEGSPPNIEGSPPNIEGSLCSIAQREDGLQVTLKVEDSHPALFSVTQLSIELNNCLRGYYTNANECSFRLNTVEVVSKEVEVVYTLIWTPISYTIRSLSGQFTVQSITVTGQEVADLMCLNGEWHSREAFHGLKVGRQTHLILMIKCRKHDSGREVHDRNLPEAQLSVSLNISERGFNYNVVKTMAIMREKSFKLHYRFLGSIEEYQLVNLTPLPLRIECMGECWRVNPNEIIALGDSKVSIGLSESDSGDRLPSEVDLRVLLKKSQHMSESARTVGVWLEGNPLSIKKGVKVKMHFQQAGKLSATIDRGLVVVGKVEGQLDVYLVGVKPGKFHFPLILLNDQLCVWKGNQSIEVV